MIITKLSGGLGNQLFQYALGRHLAIRNHTDLTLDLAGLSEGFKRSYELDRFNIQAHIATSDEIEKIVGGNYFSRKITREVNNILFYKWRRYVAERHSDFFTFNPSIFLTHDPLYITGYWQNEKYFKPIEKKIRNDFTLRNPLPEYIQEMVREISKCESVSVHIRRGDYLLLDNAKLYTTLGSDYIHTAIKEISSNVKNPHFFFFSDDIEWVKENIKTIFPHTYISNKPHEDLILMSLCKHNIIANSSFSWWGAWLNSNPNKIVIAPKKWFSDPQRDNGDLIPKEWIMI